MRTTIDLPDEFYRTLKTRAAISGVTMRELIQGFIEQGPTQPPAVTRATALSRDELDELEVEDLRAKLARSLDLNVWASLSIPGPRP